MQAKNCLKDIFCVKNKKAAEKRQEGARKNMFRPEMKIMEFDCSPLINVSDRKMLDRPQRRVAFTRYNTLAYVTLCRLGHQPEMPFEEFVGYHVFGVDKDAPWRPCFDVGLFTIPSLALIRRKPFEDTGAFCERVGEANYATTPLAGRKQCKSESLLSVLFSRLRRWCAQP